MVNAMVSANHALRNLGVVFLCTVIISRCCVKFSKPLSSSHKNRLESFNRKQRRWNWRKEIWLKSMKSMWLTLKKRCKLFSYIFSFFLQHFYISFFILLPAKNYPLWWSDLIVSTTELQRGGWVPEGIQELPLLTASSLMWTIPMADIAWQPCHQPPQRWGEKQAPTTLTKVVEKDG